MLMKDKQRIIELIETRADDDTPETVVRRIIDQMPHVTEADIAELATVRLEESRLDAAESQARIDAYSQLRNIIVETEQASGSTGLTINQTIALLKPRARRGDTRATELLNEITKAAAVFGGIESTKW